MAISATTIWRVRPSGNNVNGGGFDPGVSGVLSTTLNGAISNSATSIVTTSDTGWPASGNYYMRIGAGIGVVGDSEVVLVTGGQGTNNKTVTRGQLGTTGTAFASGTVVDNELSRCNTAPASGSVGTSTNSTTFIDATASFDLTCVGNVLWIASGVGVTVGPYTIQSRTNATTVVLDRVSGTYTAGIWKLGGAHADPQTNYTSALNYIKPGNSLYVLGSGIPNPSSYTYDYTLSTYITPPNGDVTNGRIRLIGDPCTPNAATGGVPCIRLTGGMCWYAGEYIYSEDIHFVANGTDYGDYGVITGASILVNITYDQFGYDVSLCGINSNSAKMVIGCRVFSSVAKRTTNLLYAIDINVGMYGVIIYGCNVSKCIGPGIKTLSPISIRNCLISKNDGDALTLALEVDAAYLLNVSNNTIDGNTGHAVVIVSQNALENANFIVNNMLTNHTTSGKYPITVSAGTTAQNNRVKGMVDYNVFYNNLNAPNAISYGVHDITGGADPYVDQANDDYTLTSTYINIGYPQTNFPGY